MPNPDQNQQDPWAVVSTTPAQTSASAVAPAPTATPAPANDPWAIVKQAPTASQTPDFSVGQAVFGENTALGAPVQKEFATEGSGVSDIFHGNVRQGLSKIWQSEAPHVIQGSPIEKVIQTVNPNFKGSVTSADVADYNQRKATSQPLVNAAQFIDKQKHPALKAITEAAQSLTTPETVAILASTGGLGLVESPTALATANRLLSAGFAANSIGDAYKNLKGFREAYDRGDSTDALYQMTHAVLSGALTAMASQHAVEGGTPATGPMERAVAEKAQDVGAKIGGVVEAVKEAPGKIKQAATKTVEAITPDQLAKRPETPAPQHGVPVKVESPLDGPTVGKQLGGKDLSQEALDALQKHVGDKIPVGSTAKNRLTAAVEPTLNAISETASKMNKTVNDAPSFTTSVMQDNVFGEGKFTDEIEAVKKNLPPSVREALSPDVDAVMEDADKALNSSDPSEVLEYRRKLGNQIDWDKIEKNPTTAGEVQNAARAKVYRALGEKIHSEIPETVELDKQLSPNLELRSHIRSKLGDRVVDDPLAATSEAQSEFRKGKTAIDNATHNENVAKNWQRVKYGLITLGVGSGVVHEIDKLLGL
jgi:hypothetical protein